MNTPNKINDGGPAFPNTFIDTSKPGIRNTIVVDGMTLRDWFAGLAMEATPPDFFSDVESVASRAYCIADAMIAQREKK